MDVYEFRQSLEFLDGTRINPDQASRENLVNRRRLVESPHLAWS